MSKKFLLWLGIFYAISMFLFGVGALYFHNEFCTGMFITYCVLTLLLGIAGLSAKRGKE